MQCHQELFAKAYLANDFDFSCVCSRPHWQMYAIHFKLTDMREDLDISVICHGSGWFPVDIYGELEMANNNPLNSVTDDTDFSSKCTFINHIIK